MREGPGTGAWNVTEHLARIAIEEIEAAAVIGTGIMTAGEAMIDTMTEKVGRTRTENQGDPIVMIQGATEGHAPLGTVPETMIDTGVTTVGIDARHMVEGFSMNWIVWCFNSEVHVGKMLIS